MSKIKKALMYIIDEDYRFLHDSSSSKYYSLDDAEFLKRKYKSIFKKELNLENPCSFNEKIQWLKLYDRRPEYTTMVDKYLVKEYVGNIIGTQYIIPTLGVWDSFGEIDFEKLPDRFVLKCTHDSGGLAICKNKETFDFKSARKKIEKSLKRNYFYTGREWPYKDVVPRIIAESYLDVKGKMVPEDYKIYCMNGEPKYIVVFHNRFDNSKLLSETVYDVNWKPQNFSLDEHFAISDLTEPRPECLDELLDITKKLCKDMAQVRIDYYIVNNQIYFGEITLYTASGFQRMIPESLDLELGKQLILPQKRV